MTPATFERPHGTRDKYNAERCRCTLCREAFQAYKDRRQQAIDAGEWQPFVSARPVRTHLRKLMAAGMSRRVIAEQAQVPDSTISSLLYGNPNAGRLPSRRVSPDIARRILAVKPLRKPAVPQGTVDATGTRRRLHALAVQGWSPAQIAARMGVSHTWVKRARVGQYVTSNAASAVSAVYDRLWDQAPPSRTRAERIAVSKATDHARRNGWAPPLAWNDDELDNPDARPRGMRPTTEQAA